MVALQEAVPCAPEAPPAPLPSTWADFPYGECASVPTYVRPSSGSLVDFAHAKVDELAVEDILAVAADHVQVRRPRPRPTGMRSHLHSPSQGSSLVCRVLLCFSRWISELQVF